MSGSLLISETSTLIYSSVRPVPWFRCLMNPKMFYESYLIRLGRIHKTISPPLQIFFNFFLVFSPFLFLNFKRVHWARSRLQDLLFMLTIIVRTMLKVSVTDDETCGIICMIHEWILSFLNQKIFACNMYIITSVKDTWQGYLDTIRPKDLVDYRWLFLDVSTTQ